VVDVTWCVGVASELTDAVVRGGAGTAADEEQPARDITMAQSGGANRRITA
jgi:hypothetical protein